MLKVLRHGIKSNGKYYKAHYSMGELINYPKGTITVYAKDGGGLPLELRPENNTDTREDYFETDRARILPDHPFYSEFLKCAGER